MSHHLWSKSNNKNNNNKWRMTCKEMLTRKMMIMLKEWAIHMTAVQTEAKCFQRVCCSWTIRKWYHEQKLTPNPLSLLLRQDNFLLATLNLASKLFVGWLFVGWLLVARAYYYQILFLLGAVHKLRNLNLGIFRPPLHPPPVKPLCPSSFIQP